jgi:hypothetical protein
VRRILAGFVLALAGRAAELLAQAAVFQISHLKGAFAFAVEFSCRIFSSGMIERRGRDHKRGRGEKARGLLFVYKVLQGHDYIYSNSIRRIPAPCLT